MTSMSTVCSDTASTSLRQYLANVEPLVPGAFLPAWQPPCHLLTCLPANVTHLTLLQGPGLPLYTLVGNHDLTVGREAYLKA
jgi:hypothetical protein